MIDPFLLPQTLILPPKTPFETVRAGLLALNFQEITPGVRPHPATQNPANATFSWRGQFPVIDYLYDPDCGLGRLEVGTTPPALRAAIAETTGYLQGSGIARLLQDADPGIQFFALRAAELTERLDLIHDIRGLASHGPAELHDIAAKIAQVLGDLANGQLDTLAGTRLIAQSAIDLIAAFTDRDVVMEHLPKPDDCAGIFLPEIADQVAEALEHQRWPKRGISAAPTRAKDVFAAPAGLFRWPNRVSDEFPRGYRKIAGWLQPGRIWLGWTAPLDGGGVVRHDGLVFVDDNWMFFPKPYRVVVPLLPAELMATALPARTG